MSSGPLLTLAVHEALLAARAQAPCTLTVSLDLDRTRSEVEAHADHWCINGSAYPYAAQCKERTVYHWTGTAFAPVSRYDRALIKLVPTDWGPPTFEIDGIKMLPTAQVSPFADAQRKVGLIAPRGKTVLDCCGGLGYFANWCLREGATQVLSFEKNPDVVWLRSLNPWSPENDQAEAAAARLKLRPGDISLLIAEIPGASVDAVLHDPPRFGIAGELYSQAFYDQLARVLKPGGRMFHYTGMPNKLTSGRDVPREVATRLQRAGFATQLEGDGVLAVRNGGRGNEGRMPRLEPKGRKR